MEPLFSVIIPLYNKEKYIGNALQSVLNQTYKNFEVLVVNDGSTDKSLDVVNTFNDTRLKVFTKVNGGVSEARNFGVERAMYEYVALLDADDKWHPGFLKGIIRLINKYPGNGLYASAFEYIKPRGVRIYGDKLPEGIVEDFFKVKLQDSMPSASAVVIKKQVFNEVGGFPVGMVGGEDDFAFSKMAGKFSMVVTPEVLAFRNGEPSTFYSRLGKLDSCKESWFDLYEEGNFYKNEFIARKAIYAGIRYAYHPHQNKSKEIEEQTRNTVLSKKLWRVLFHLNRLPYIGRVIWRGISQHFQNVKFWSYKLSKLKTSFRVSTI